MKPTETTVEVIEQLKIFGKVALGSPTSGIFEDRAKNIWTWSVLIHTVTIEKAGFRPRHIDYENVSLYMFEWLWEDEACRPFLEFTLRAADVVKLFGKKNAHDAFVAKGK